MCLLNPGILRLGGWMSWISKKVIQNEGWLKRQSEHGDVQVKVKIGSDIKVLLSQWNHECNYPLIESVTLWNHKWICCNNGAKDSSSFSSSPMAEVFNSMSVGIGQECKWVDWSGLGIKNLIESGRKYSELASACPISKRAGLLS